MKGANSMNLNQATMCEAIEYWLTNKVFNKDENSPIVSGVKELSQRGEGFEIKLSENDAKTGTGALTRHV